MVTAYSLPEIVVRPPTRFDLDLRELWRERELLFFPASRNVRIRYKQALAGPGVGSLPATAVDGGVRRALPGSWPASRGRAPICLWVVVFLQQRSPGR